MSSVAQLLRQAESLKASVSDPNKTISETWVSRQKLEDLYKKMLLMDLEYALDKKIEMELWNFAFKNQITNLQGQAKDKQNVKRAEVQASLNLFLETASGFYQQFVQVICTTFKLDLPFRRKSAYFGIMKEKSPLKLKVTPPKKSSCLYVCQYCLVHLGDIARYRQQIDQAQTYYWHAANLVPFNGQPYNQLAILEAAKGNKLSTVFYYIRSLAVKVPFPVAATNLEKLYAKLAKETPEYIGKLSVSEMITGFLQFHALIHLCTDLKKAEGLGEKLAAGLPAHVTSQSFPWQMLVHIVAINIFAMNYVQNKPLESSSGSSVLSDVKMGLDEEECFNLIFKLTVTMLDILLQYTPKQEHKVREYFTLPAIKLLLDWLRHNPEHFNNPALLSSTQLWVNLGKVLNSLQLHQNKHDEDLSNYEELPLPEDAELRCFQPFEKAQSCYSYSRVPQEGLPSEIEVQLRCQRLLAHGHWIKEEFPSLNLSVAASSKPQKVMFNLPPATIPSSKSPTLSEADRPAGQERKSNRHNVAIQAIIQKQAQEDQDKSSQTRQEQVPGKYLLGVPMTEPQFMKPSSGRQQLSATGQSPQSSTKQSGILGPVVVLQNDDNTVGRVSIKSSPGTKSVQQQQQITQQQQQQAPRLVSSWQPQQKPAAEPQKQWNPASANARQSPWQLQRSPQQQQQTWSPQQQSSSQVGPDHPRAPNPGPTTPEGSGTAMNGMQLPAQKPAQSMYQANPSQIKPQMQANEIPPQRFPGQLRGQGHMSDPHHPLMAGTPLARNIKNLAGGHIGGMDVPLMFQQPPPNFNKPARDLNPGLTGPGRITQGQGGITPGNGNFPHSSLQPTSQLPAGHPGNFPNAPGQERSVNASNRPPRPAGLQRPPFPGQQMPMQMSQGQAGNQYQNFLNFQSIGMNQQKGLSALEGLFTNSNQRYPGQQDDFPLNMSDFLGNFNKIAVQPPKGSIQTTQQTQRSTHSTFQGHAEGTPKPENYSVTNKGLPVPTLNVALESKPSDTLPTTGPGTSQASTNQQGMYSLFSGSPWLSSADSKSLGSSPFSSQSSSIRNSPDPADSYGDGSSNLDLGLRFSKAEDWNNKAPPSTGQPPPGPFFPNNNMQSIWSSSHAQSPLERLLELQKQQRQTEPH